MSFHCKFLPQGAQSTVNPFLIEQHDTFVGLLDYIFPTCQFWIFFIGTFLWFQCFYFCSRDIQSKHSGKRSARHKNCHLLGFQTYITLCAMIFWAFLSWSHELLTAILWQNDIYYCIHYVNVIVIKELLWFKYYISQQMCVYLMKWDRKWSSR